MYFGNIASILQKTTIVIFIGVWHEKLPKNGQIVIFGFLEC